MDGLIILLPIALLAFIFLSGRKRQREAQAVQSNLVPGAEVLTTAGLYATITEVEPDSVVLETSPGVQSRWARAAVARITTAAEDVEAADAQDAADAAGDRAPGDIDADSYAVPDDLSGLDRDTREARDGGEGDPRGGRTTRGGIDDPGGRRP